MSKEIEFIFSSEGLKYWEKYQKIKQSEAKLMNL